MARYLTCAETAQLVRAALKEAYPETKFSVRSKVYTGGSKIDIEWTDGPSQNHVAGLTARFRGATFDAMIDLKETRYSTLDGETVCHGADWINLQRHYTEPFYGGIARRLARQFGLPEPQIVADAWGMHPVDDPFVTLTERLSFRIIGTIMQTHAPGTVVTV